MHTIANSPQKPILSLLNSKISRLYFTSPWLLSPSESPPLNAAFWLTCSVWGLLPLCNFGAPSARSWDIGALSWPWCGHGRPVVCTRSVGSRSRRPHNGHLHTRADEPLWPSNHERRRGSFGPGKILSKSLLAILQNFQLDNTALPFSIATSACAFEIPVVDKTVCRCPLLLAGERFWTSHVTPISSGAYMVGGSGLAAAHIRTHTLTKQGVAPPICTVSRDGGVGHWDHCSYSSCFFTRATCASFPAHVTIRIEEEEVAMLQTERQKWRRPAFFAKW